MINPLFIIIGVIVLLGLQIFLFLISFMHLGIGYTLGGALIITMLLGFEHV